LRLRCRCDAQVAKLHPRSPHAPPFRRANDGLLSCLRFPDKLVAASAHDGSGILAREMRAGQARRVGFTHRV